MSVFEGIYANMKFERVPFAEYPKEIKLADGSAVIANDKRHELDLMAADVTTPPPPHPAEVENAALLDKNSALEEEAKAAQELVAEHEAEKAQMQAMIDEMTAKLAAVDAPAKPPLKQPGATDGKTDSQKS